MLAPPTMNLKIIKKTILRISQYDANGLIMYLIAVQSQKSVTKASANPAAIHKNKKNLKNNVVLTVCHMVN